MRRYDEAEHFPVLDNDDGEYRLMCTCGWFGGRHETIQDALDAHADHEAGEYAT